MSVSSAGQGLRPGVCTSTTRPSSPYTGMTIYETDTGYLRVWDGSAWDYLSQSQSDTIGLGPVGGLIFIKSQNIGSGVSSVTVDNAFSSTYDSYKVIVTGGAASGTTYLNLRLGLNTGPDSGSIYQESMFYTTLTNTPQAVGQTATNVSYAGTANANGIAAMIELVSPYQAGKTMISCLTAALGSFVGTEVCLVNSNTQYTHFTLYPNAGTLTGGVIRVYGYRNS